VTELEEDRRTNSSPLISLAKIESFNLLRQLYGTLTISTEVYEEVVISGATLPGSSETSGSSWIQVKRVTRPHDVAAAQQRFGLVAACIENKPLKSRAGYSGNEAPRRVSALQTRVSAPRLAPQNFREAYKQYIGSQRTGD
jgi:hypothetical protein